MKGLSGPVSYGNTRFEVQQTVDGLSSRCAVFDHMEDARLFMVASDLLKVMELALPYLDHEAVQNIGFAVNPFVVANYAKEVIAKVKGE